jgi:hypothetical protein
MIPVTLKRSTPQKPLDTRQEKKRLREPRLQKNVGNGVGLHVFPWWWIDVVRPIGI